MKHDYLDTSLWYREKINNPYQIIVDFFSAADIASHRRTIKSVLRAVCTNRIWRKDNPGDLLYDFKLFESVINAAYLINKEKKKVHCQLVIKIFLTPIYTLVGMLTLPNGIISRASYLLKNFRTPILFLNASLDT